VTADIYTLISSNDSQTHRVQQRLIVRLSVTVEKGQVIVVGPCTDRGELAWVQRAGASCHGRLQL